MQIKFNYNGIEFLIDPAQHFIKINGETAAGTYAPVGGVVVEVNDEEPDICFVITDADNKDEEKIIVYGAPLKVGDKVIILDRYVIPADLFTRNDLEGDYKVYSDKLKNEAEKYEANCRQQYDNTKKLYDEVNSFFNHEIVELTENMIGKMAEEAEFMAGEINNV